jgi:hypothetical protein
MSVNLEAEIEEFITHPIPYELDAFERSGLRSDVRSYALSHLLGALSVLIEYDSASAETLMVAIRNAFTAAHRYQSERTAHLTAPPSA